MRWSSSLNKLLLLVAVVPLMQGCFGRFSVAACEQADRYENALDAAPVQVPDDLTPPDESRALKIPSLPPEIETVEKRGDCLESPPEYFEGGLPS
jgi:uncharacterized lipoprotein